MLKYLLLIPIAILFWLAFKRAGERGRRLRRNFGLTSTVAKTAEVGRRIPINSPPPQTVQTDTLLPAQPRAAIHAPFLKLGAMDTTSRKPGRVRQRPKCDCPERGPSDGDRIHQNVICLKCRGSVPVKLAS